MSLPTIMVSIKEKYTAINQLGQFEFSIDGLQRYWQELQYACRVPNHNIWASNRRDRLITNTCLLTKYSIKAIQWSSDQCKDGCKENKREQKKLSNSHQLTTTFQNQTQNCSCIVPSLNSVDIKMGLNQKHLLIITRNKASAWVARDTKTATTASQKLQHFLGTLTLTWVAQWVMSFDWALY